MITAATAHRLLAAVAGTLTGPPTREGLKVALGDAVDRLGIGGILRRLVPEGLPQRPRAEVLTRRLWGQVALETASEVSARLAEAGVSHAFFKGAALLGRPYEGDDITMSDVDVLVRGGTRVALDALAKGGFDLQDHGSCLMEGAPVRSLASANPDLLHVDVDLHGRLWPAGRLLPWKGRELPGGFWNQLDTTGPFPVPRPGHHAALLVHHLVRHDLLHFRSVLDLLALWPSLRSPAEASALHRLAGELDVRWAAGALTEALARGLGLASVPLPARNARVRRWGRPDVGVRSLVALAVTSSGRDYQAVTLRRGLRRLGLVDGIGAARGVVRDALLPPAAYVAWRWPEVRGARGRLLHLTRFARRFADA